MQKSKDASRSAALVSTRSYAGLNIVNFFLAELVGVILPFLSTYLKQRGWKYNAIGIAIAIGGLGTFLMQIPAGIFSDHVVNRRLLLGSASIFLILCHGTGFDLRCRLFAPD